MIVAGVHRDHAVGLQALAVLQYICDYTRLPSSVALQNAYGISDFEALANLETFDLDCERLLFVRVEGHNAVLAESDEANAIFELTFDYFDALADGY